MINSALHADRDLGGGQGAGMEGGEHAVVAALEVNAFAPFEPSPVGPDDEAEKADKRHPGRRSSSPHPMTCLPSERDLLPIEASAQQGHAIRRKSRPMVTEPAFASGLLAILFVMAILRHDGFRWQGNHLGKPRTNHDWGNRRVIIQGLPIGELAGKTMLTMDNFVGKVLSALARHS